MNKKYITGFVLTGGKSSRLGVEKGLMLFDRKPLVQHVLETLSVVVGEVFISANNPDYKQFSKPIIPDIVQGIGPMGGVYSCLMQSATDYNIFLSCDTPFVPSDLFLYLIKEIDGHSCVVPVHDDEKTEPLCGIYSKQCADTFMEFISKGNYKMMDVLKAVDYHPVRVDESLPFYNNHLFFNINTPADCKLAMQNLQNNSLK